jgi:hypothetical protein
MSADNGIYVAAFPTATGEKEYRVAHCQGIEDCDLSFVEGEAARKAEDKNRYLHFGQAPSYNCRKAAIFEAHQLAKEFPILEYGVVEMEFDRPLVNACNWI